MVCAKCKFWVKFTPSKSDQVSDDVGRCRRRAPMAFGSEAADQFFVFGHCDESPDLGDRMLGVDTPAVAHSVNWPVTFSGDWCGDWVEK